MLPLLLVLPVLLQGSLRGSPEEEDHGHDVAGGHVWRPRKPRTQDGRRLCVAELPHRGSAAWLRLAAAAAPAAAAASIEFADGAMAQRSRRIFSLTHLVSVFCTVRGLRTDHGLLERGSGIRLLERRIGGLHVILPGLRGRFRRGRGRRGGGTRGSF